MNLKTYIREHHFYVTIAKHVFLHIEKGIVFVSDPIRLKDAEKFNLKPLILYGLTVPGTQIEWYTFSLFDEPRSLFNVLLEGWEKASGLRGYPDNLKINRHIANACSHLQSSLSHIGDISLVGVVSRNPRKFCPLKLRPISNRHGIHPNNGLSFLPGASGRLSRNSENLPFDEFLPASRRFVPSGRHCQ
jgi:hypothetical protein